MTDDTELESVARPILVKMLQALDNEEKIQASSPIELLNCIMKILRMVREDNSNLAGMVKERIGGIADLAEIKNPELTESEQERTDISQSGES